MLFTPLILLIGVAQALPWDGARPTENIVHPLRYHEPPKPTKAVELRKRQAPGDITCAWENGQGGSTSGLYCPDQAVCATNSLGLLWCCNISSLDNCAFSTTCIDSTDVAGYSLSYGVNNFALSCTEAQDPICITRIVELGNVVTAWGCGSPDDAAVATYYSTYWNASVANTMSLITYYNAVYPYYSPASLRISTTTSTTSTTPTTSTTSTPTSSSSSIVTTTPASSSPPSSTPIGAIAGGTIGGVAVIIGLVLLAFFIHRRSKQNRNNQSPYTGEAVPTPQPHDPTPPMHFAQHPMQYGYAYGSHPLAQPQFPSGPASYPEKLPAQGSPQMSSPGSASPGFSTSVPPYSQAHELGE